MNKQHIATAPLYFARKGANIQGSGFHAKHEFSIHRVGKTWELRKHGKTLFSCSTKGTPYGRRYSDWQPIAKFLGVTIYLHAHNTDYTILP